MEVKSKGTNRIAHQLRSRGAGKGVVTERDGREKKPREYEEQKPEEGKG